MIVQVWELTCKTRSQKEGRVNKKIKTRLKRKFANGKIEHVKEGSTLNIQVKIIDQIYNQRFQKRLDYHWIQKSMVWMLHQGASRKLEIN
jgi:hypothetical protein